MLVGGDSSTAASSGVRLNSPPLEGTDDGVGSVGSGIGANGFGAAAGRSAGGRSAAGWSAAGGS